MLLSLVLLTIWSSLVYAQFEPPDFCYSACQQFSRAVQFNTTNPETGKLWVNDACRNELRIASLYLCARVSCTEEERVRGANFFNQTCLTFSNTTIPPYSLVEGYTDKDIGRLYRVQPEDVFTSTPSILNEVVVPSEKLFQLAFNTLVLFQLLIESYDVVIFANTNSRMLPTSKKPFMSNMGKPSR